jgi:hypothetical protein
MLNKLKGSLDCHTETFQGRRHGPTANLNQVNLTLIPFTIDHFEAWVFFCQPPPTIHHRKKLLDKPADFTSDAACQTTFSKSIT